MHQKETDNMVELNTPIEKIIKDKRSLRILKEQGFRTYYDIKDLTLTQLREMSGLGEVSVQRVYLALNDLKK